MTDLERRIIDISYQHRLSHIGSCLTALPIIEEIFKNKRPDEKFVLSCGHAGLALYVVLESYGLADAENLLHLCGIHPDRQAAPDVIDCSTGSLGQGLPIALGMAMADRSKNVYCLISDGELSEGSVYETLNNKIDTLHIYCNYNGWSAYEDIQLSPVFKGWGVNVVDTRDHWFIRRYGQEAHYKVLTESDYAEIIR